ncbi:MAG: MFS transporter, partial [Oleibacter sp.]|nr:MFS transporter [Thalassolituus sp.]
MKTTKETAYHSQYSLLKNRRFAPFFFTQYFGAFNDNIFKNSLLAMITYGLLSSNMNLGQINNIGAMLFILPFFLFSAIGGQLADKFDKKLVIQRIKLAEIVIMLLAAVCFYFSNTWGLLCVLFLMGTQSAVFGPAKYSIIPQHLTAKELIGGNALVETGTFLAILTGTICAGLISSQNNALIIAAVAVITFSILGYLSSLFIPKAPAASPNVKLNLNPITATRDAIKITWHSKILLACTLAISWFWFMGAAYLTQIFAFTRDYIGGDQSVVTLLLATFSIGIAAGSLMCEKLSKHIASNGLVIYGSLGLTLAGLDLVFFPVVERPTAALFQLSDFLQAWQHWKILSDFFFIGVSGGLYIVPLYALAQRIVDPKHISRAIS